jgi:hypothetical protein
LIPVTEPENPRTVAGAGTDQHIQGLEETGTFTTDEPPAYTRRTGRRNERSEQHHADHADHAEPGSDPERF